MYNTILHLYNPNWINCAVTQVSHALSNYVFIVHNNDTNETVIIRKYMSPPRVSLSVISHIGTLGYGPKILFSCEEGTVEEFIDGRKMTYAEMISDVYSKQVACQLKLLHQAGYTHLDLHHNNMLIDSTNTVRFIDYEYCQDASNDNCILDIANHFCEWSYDYDTTDWFLLKPIDNSIQHMIRFVHNYLGTEPNAQYILDIQNAMNISHRKWIDWALSYYEITKNEIYMKYANERSMVNDIIYTFEHFNCNKKSVSKLDITKSM
jgi:thiamine kinase-like enzyme